MVRVSVKRRLSYLLIGVAFIFSAWVTLYNSQKTRDFSPVSDLLEIHFIDVGQADSILIKQGESAFLIDGGNNGDAEAIIDYLEKKAVEDLDFVIGTHPHEDHIGGLDNVIDHFDVETFLMPNVVAHTKTYEDVLSSAKRRNLAVTYPNTGQTFSFGYGEFKILSPSSKMYGELNNYSIAIRLVYGDHCFLFMGDCELENEREMLDSGLTLDSDIIKLGHHGSDSSSSERFLTAVSPEYAIISVGQDNDYNHPSQSVLDLLDKLGVQVFRTDLEGTIVFTTDGESLTVKLSSAF